MANLGFTFDRRKKNSYVLTVSFVVQEAILIALIIDKVPELCGF